MTGEARTVRFFTEGREGNEGVTPKQRTFKKKTSQNGKICVDFVLGRTDSMRVISRKLLREYWRREPAAEGQLKAWFAEAEQAEWRGPADVKRKYGNASILKDERVVFNICGNKYRLIVRINYQFRVVYVRFVGSHAEYDKIDAETI